MLISTSDSYIEENISSCNDGEPATDMYLIRPLFTKFYIDTFETYTHNPLPLFELKALEKSWLNNNWIGIYLLNGIESYYPTLIDISVNGRVHKIIIDHDACARNIKLLFAPGRYSDG